MSIEDKIARRLKGLDGRVAHVETLIEKPHRKQEERIAALEESLADLTSAFESNRDALADLTESVEALKSKMVEVEVVKPEKVA